MGKIKALKIFFLAVGLCLCIAWVSAIYAAERQSEAVSQRPSNVDQGLTLVKSDLESVIVELRTPSYRKEEVSVDGIAYHLLTVTGYGQTVDVGKPQLPLKGTLLGIPQEAELSLRVLEVEEEIVPERYNVYPVPQPVVEYDPEGYPAYVRLEFVKDDRVYSGDTFYPAAVAEVGSSAFIRDQRVVDLRFFPFQYNPVSGQLRLYRRIRVEVRFSYPRGQPLVTAGLGQDDPFSQVLERSLLNYNSARGWRATPLSTLESRLGYEQSQTAYKVLVDQDGIYRLTGSDLQGVGVDLGDAEFDALKLHNEGHELAIQVVDQADDGDFDPEDYILFYGERLTSIYSDINVYWLTFAGLGGLRMPERDGTLSAGTVLSYFQTTSRWEEDLYYHALTPKPPTVPSEEEIDHWFGGGVVADGQPASASYDLVLDNLATSSPPYSSTVRGYLHGYTYDDTAYPDHHTLVYLNGHLLEDIPEYWDGQVPYEFEDEAPDSYLTEGTNVISVECPGDLGLGREIIYTHWFEIDYRRTYTVENDSLVFDGDGAGTWQYMVGDFLTDTIEVFDITHPLSVTRIVSKTVEESSSYVLKFEDTIDGEHHYLALTREQYQSPLDIVEYTPADLRNSSDGADYVIITHPDFYDAVLCLRDHRAAQGLRTVVIDVRDIYDEFSYGIFDPRAIRDFLSYTYRDWTPPAPSYVLLVGDGNYDFKDHRDRGEPNYVPPYLIYADQALGETAADNRYVCFDGEGDILPDMHIGRLPAQTAAQASAMINKIIGYEGSLPEGEWKAEVLFVADNPEPETAGDFWALSDDIADNYLPPPPIYTAEKVYYLTSTYTTPSAVNAAIINAFATGRLLINYVGHSSPTAWAPDHVFLTVGDVASLPESDKNPMILPMTCLEGYFIDNRYSCLGESLVRVAGKGAIASWSPTSAGESAGQHYLHRGFYDAVFAKGVHQIGPAALLGKLDLYQNAGGGYRGLIDTYGLFGDPAMKLPVESYLVFLPLAVKGY